MHQNLFTTLHLRGTSSSSFQDSIGKLRDLTAYNNFRIRSARGSPQKGLDHQLYAGRRLNLPKPRPREISILLERLLDCITALFFMHPTIRRMKIFVHLDLTSEIAGTLTRPSTKNPTWKGNVSDQRMGFGGSSPVANLSFSDSYLSCPELRSPPSWGIG